MKIDWAAYHANARPDSLATVDLSTGRRANFRQFSANIDGYCQLLADRGVKAGDRVGILIMNSSEYLAIVLACWRSNCVALTLNFRLSQNELSYIVGDADPKLLFVDSELIELWDAIGQSLDSDLQILVLDVASAQFSPPSSDKSFVVEDDYSPDRLAMLMYSSGTTGRPKGVRLTHGNIFAGMQNLLITYGMPRHVVSYAIMPLFHIGSMLGFSLPALFIGGTAVVDRSFDPGRTLATIHDPDLAVTHFLGLPAIYNALGAHPDVDRTDFSRIQVALASAEPIPEAMLIRWKERGLLVHEAYGLTETTGIVCAMASEDVKRTVGYAGRESMFCTVRIMADAGREADPGEAGEIWAKGRNVMPGYWNSPENDADAFVDGWFRTGDIGYKTPEGYIKIEGRLKDMYISGGENVYPAEVERVLYMMPEIAEVAVVGVPSERWGESGCAVIVAAPGTQVTIEAVRSHCAAYLAKFKHPQELVMAQALPRNATGKILKFKVREMLQLR
ncbi:AMP-binding protein [Sphingobium estronivorans]|uniref:AMP-binding protein n=1 Tax=Sphingobium estronivorans TaxID=1577690 RepID=UPI00123A4712|nr:AMP-binding protein [Sphingobium estronivorans]